MNGLLNCFPEKMLIVGMLFFYWKTGDLSSVTPEAPKNLKKNQHLRVYYRARKFSHQCTRKRGMDPSDAGHSEKCKRREKPAG